MASCLKQSWKTLNVSLANRILTISMNRPKVNSMTVGLLTDLEQAFDHASTDDQIKGVHLRSNMNSTFSAGLDLSEMYERCSSGDPSRVEKFMFHTLARGITAPIRCTKPVACSLDGHAIAGGIILALTCDYLTIGTRKPFSIGLTELPVGVPFPVIPIEIVRHQLDPQLAHRLIFDGNLVSSTDFSARCERGENADELALKWLQMISQRPLEAFQITKKKWWSEQLQSADGDNEQQRKEYIQTITSEGCLQAMKRTLKK